jgi:Ca-activated chloride channel family protein
MAQNQQVQEVRDIVLTLDLSLSMDTPIASASGQKYTTRLDVVQQATLEFVRWRQHDRLALLVFGDEPFGAWPLSTDSTTLQSRLQHLKTLLPAPMRGTHVAKALEQALDYLQFHGQARTKVVLLMTDGLDMLTPETQARLARRFEQQQVTLYVLGLDLPATSNIMQFIQQAGAQYFNIARVEELGNAIRHIDRLETSYITVIQPTARQELYPYFAMPALLLLFIATVLHSTWAVEV